MQRRRGCAAQLFLGVMLTPSWKLLEECIICLETAQLRISARHAFLLDVYLGKELPITRLGPFVEGAEKGVGLLVL